MLGVFDREEVWDVCCVVTRYFGGILLGASGLTRAYAKGAKDALNASGVAEMRLWAKVEVPCTYSLLERMKLEIEASQGRIEEIAYAADVRISALLPSEQEGALQERLTELSAGALSITVQEERFRPGPRQESR